MLKRRSWLFLLIPVFLNFDYASYKEVPASFFKEISDNYEKRDGPGLGIYYEKFRFAMEMQDFPTELSKSSQNILEQYSKLTMRGPDFEKAFGYEIQVKIDNVEYTMIFQSVLIPYLKKEFQKGKRIQLFCGYGAFNTFSKRHYLFVNEFQIGDPPKPYVRSPIKNRRIFAMGTYDATND